MADLHTVSEANDLIDAGKRLHIAGDEAALSKLHKGVWIGGTIPYFLTQQGGVMDRQRLFITELPDCVSETKIAFISSEQLAFVPADAPENGFSLVIAPGMSDVHATYALKAEKLPHIYERPIIGWVAGVHLSEIGAVKPKVVNGMTGAFSDDRLVVLHATLPENRLASIGIVNVFRQGAGDAFVFDETGFSGGDCLVNGKNGNFYDYAKERNIDLRFPLVANYSGEMINVSIQELDRATRSAKFYAPILKGMEYRQAEPVADYRAKFIEQMEGLQISPAFSCNCILNYLYGNLEGEQPIPVGGPATFGEIAYVLLNQTMVFLSINEV